MLGSHGGTSWISYWTTLISATVENAAPTDVVLTFPSAKTSLGASDFSVTVNCFDSAITNAVWVGGVLTLTISDTIVYGDSVVVTFEKTGETANVTNNILNWVVDYPAVGSVIEVSHGVTFASNQFTISKTLTAFFFIDNGLNMTAYFNGIVWQFFYVVYGKLYNWYAIDPARVGVNSFTSSDIWRVPSSTDWTTLTDYCISLGGGIDATNVGNHLKSRRQNGSPLGAPWNVNVDPRWFSNVTHWGLDTFRHGIVPGGSRKGTDGTWATPGGRTDRWTTTSAGANVTERYLRYTAGTVDSLSGAYAKYGYSINIIRNATVAEQLLADGTVVDAYIQNNGYPLKCVKIGTQVWTSEVFETKWRDGTEIPFEGATEGLFSDAEWAALATPGVCNYNNEEIYNHHFTYSPLFNKYANNPIITQGGVGSWEVTGIRDPVLLVDSNGDMVQEGGKYIMYYNGRGAGITRVGRATSTDKITWVKEATNPIFADVNYAGAGSVIKRGDGDYIMYYHYDGATKFNYATSVDGLTWTRNDVGDPIMEIADFPGSVTMGLPNVVEIDGTQYMVFELWIGNWQVYMMKSVNWIDWVPVGRVFTPTAGYFDFSVQANPSIYKVTDNYYIIIYNGQSTAVDDFNLGILHSNNVETGWKRLQDMPVLYNAVDGLWDDTRIEGGRVYRDRINQSCMELFYFGLPTADSFNNGAIGYAKIKPLVTFEYQVV